MAWCGWGLSSFYRKQFYLWASLHSLRSFAPKYTLTGSTWFVSALDADKDKMGKDGVKWAFLLYRCSPLCCLSFSSSLFLPHIPLWIYRYEKKSFVAMTAPPPSFWCLPLARSICLIKTNLVCSLGTTELLSGVSSHLLIVFFPLFAIEYERKIIKIPLQPPVLLCGTLTIAFIEKKGTGSWQSYHNRTDFLSLSQCCIIKFLREKNMLVNWNTR